VKINNIDHTTLYVNSIDSVIKFYAELFEFTVTPGVSEDGRYLMVENDQIHFFILEDASISKKFIAKQHLSFSVPSLKPVYEQLKSMGVSYQRGTFNGFKKRNFDWCEWIDPEGIRLECVEHID